MRGKLTFKCKVRDCLTLTARGRRKLSSSYHNVVDYNCITSGIMADKFEFQDS